MVKYRVGTDSCTYRFYIFFFINYNLHYPVLLHMLEMAVCIYVKGITLYSNVYDTIDSEMLLYSTD